MKYLADRGVGTFFIHNLNRWNNPTDEGFCTVFTQNHHQWNNPTDVGVCVFFSQNLNRWNIILMKVLLLFLLSTSINKISYWWRCCYIFTGNNRLNNPTDRGFGAFFTQDLNLWNIQPIEVLMLFFTQNHIWWNNPNRYRL